MHNINNLFRLISCLFIFALAAELSAQNFTNLTGATGTITGNGITVDTVQYTYVVGGIKIDGPSVEFMPNHQPTLPISSAQAMAYITRNTINGFVPDQSAFITVDTGGVKPDLSSCGLNNSDNYVVANKVVLANNNRIYVLGVFKGCNLMLHDKFGTPTLSTNSIFSGFTNQKVFVATYDSNFTPVACHIFCTETGIDAYAVDIARGISSLDGRLKLFMVSDFETDFINVESFGAVLPPNAAFNPMATIDPNSYDILLAQFDVLNEQYEKAVVLGGIEDDHSGELASGFLGMYNSQDLYLTGAFEGVITFVHPINGTTVLVSSGNFDAFACRIPGFDINFQEPAVIGGPWNEMGLSLTDNGRFCGGYISRDAVFDMDGGNLQYYTTPPNPDWTPFSGANYSPGDKKEHAFIAQPNYSLGIWVSIDTIVDDTFDTQTTELASGNCNDFMSAISRGMHPGVMGLPHEYFLDIHLF